MPVNFEEIRKREWPVLETMTFLDAACVSFAPQRSVHALKELADFSGSSGRGEFQRTPHRYGQQAP